MNGNCLLNPTVHMQGKFSLKLPFALSIHNVLKTSLISTFFRVIITVRIKKPEQPSGI